MSDSSRAGDACSTWDVKVCPVGWQRCLVQSPWQANAALVDGHNAPMG